MGKKNVEIPFKELFPVKKGDGGLLKISDNAVGEDGVNLRYNWEA